jgi:TonB family protein
VFALHAAGDGEGGSVKINGWRFLVLAGWFLAAPAVNAQGQSDSAPAAPAASDANAALPTRVRVSSGVMGGLLLKKVAPHYPEDARQAHIQGTVMLHALISRTGDIADLQLVSGPPELTNAAMKAVRKWKYKPTYSRDSQWKLRRQSRLTSPSPTGSASVG